ncbi:hypothetical protein [Streptomyces capparidis]
MAPAFGNNCQNTYRQSTVGNTVSTHPGSVTGNGISVSMTGPFNRCGSADAAPVNPPGVVVPPPNI